MSSAQRYSLITFLFFLVLSIAEHSAVYALQGYPHFLQNEIECESCHFVHGTEPKLLPEWTKFDLDPNDIDDTQFNSMCRSCHFEGGSGPSVETHSSGQTDDSYGEWTVECRVCHNPHFQVQAYTYTDPGDYLYQGVSTDIDFDLNTITQSGVGWQSNAFEGMIVIPNKNEIYTSYKIVSNTPDTLTVAVPMDVNLVTAGDTFVISYGKLINNPIILDEILNGVGGSFKTGSKPVMFIQATGLNSFADGGETYDGICEACHTMTDHFRNDGLGGDQLHTNIGGAAGTNCTAECHKHTSGFAHGKGPGTLCEQCHGHEDGYGGSAPGTYFGSTQSHSTHAESDDDLIGPRPVLVCSDCHNTDIFPLFRSKADPDAELTLAQTDICNDCHSDGGTYNGVDSVNGSIGAKDNWSDGVYDGSSLRSGKEKWCATCHDDEPSVIDGVTAPNVIGDEDNSEGEGKYEGWGFYMSGHGLPVDEFYSSKGGFLEPSLKPGVSRPVDCDSCHDFATAHIDGEPRTFNDNDDPNTDPSVYRQGYRLSLVDGEEPMQVPWFGLPNEPARYRLCAECHITRPFTGSSISETNLVTGGINRHYKHLAAMPGLWAKPDFEGDANSSRPTCTICHNVHGSTQLAMVRDGKLIGREPGMEMWYYNEDTTLVDEGNIVPPNPEDTPLAASDGTVWIGRSSGNLCGHCHGGYFNTSKEPRGPFQDISVAPTLDWTGENGYVSDGADPDSGVTGNTFTFRVKYIDTNNDDPIQVQVWIDQDNNIGNGYEDQLAMNADDPADVNYIDGKIYTLSVIMNNTGANTKNYRFYAVNAPDGPAMGSPIQNSSVYVFDTGSGGGNTPILNWTGEVNYTDDGINPDNGNGGETSFTFRVDYADESSPALIQVWIDEDDNGVYGAVEKFAMTEDAPGNRYTLSRILSYNGDGTLNFRFYATDGTLEATGDPTAEQSVSLTNSIPVLSWTGEANYVSDGVDPGTGNGGDSFTFQVKYTDGDNVAPAPVQVWVDTDNSDTYDVHEKFDMTWVDDGGKDYTNDDNGENYTITLPVPYISDGNITYRFYGSDGADDATGDPVSDTVLIITTPPPANNAPVLSWATADCLSNGVRPGVGAEQVDFEFKVIYTDDDNECPTDILLLIDEDDSGTYESDEKYVMTAGDSADCDAGRLYETTLNLSSAGDEDLNYSFYATDGKEAATGMPVESDSTVTVIDDPIRVRPSGGAGWLTTIQSAEDSSFNSSTIVVYPNDDFTAATYVENIEARTVNLTMRSACGPDLTIIDGTNIGIGVMLRADNQVFDGFSVTNGTVGLWLNPGPVNVTIKNSKIYGNIGHGIDVNLAGIVHIENNEIYNNGSYGINANNASPLDLKNCDIHHNASGGFYLNGGVHTIADSLIRDNTVSGIHFNNAGDGNIVKNNKIYGNSLHGIMVNGGILVHIENNEIYNNSSRGISTNNGPPLDIKQCDIHHNSGGGILLKGGIHTITDTLIRENSDGDGGGVYFTGVGVGTTVTNTTIRDNQASGRGGGMYFTGGSQVTFDKCIITGNQTTSSGGAMYVQNASNPIVKNSIIAENQAAGVGGAVVNHSGAPSFFNVTFADNIATYGGVFWSCAGNYIVARNSIFWGNEGTSAGDIASRYNCCANCAPLVDISYSSLDESQAGSTAGSPPQSLLSDNITPAVDPLFAGDGNYHITSGSPVIDQAHPDYAPVDDFDGEARPVGSGDDMGADEFAAGSNTAPTLSWTGETSFGDGMHPDSGTGGDVFEFRISYTDADNEAPVKIQIWIDADDDNSFLSSYLFNEKIDMTEVDSGDIDYTDGKLYTISQPLYHHPDGTLKYRFYATDGPSNAIGDPTLDNTYSVTLANNIAVGGFEDDNVIPMAQVTQSSSGDGIITINWKGRDIDSYQVNLNTFEYSVDSGTSWSAPTNGDASAALSVAWEDNSYNTAATFTDAVAHSFTFDTRHVDVTGLAGVDQSDVQIRFTVNDGTDDSALPVTSESFRVDNVAPTNTITSTTYNAASDTLTITGSGFTTIATAGTEIKSYVDWTKFIWDINDDGPTTADITIVMIPQTQNVGSLTVTDDTTLTLVFSAAKGEEIEGTIGYGPAPDDTLDVSAGFSKDEGGNAAGTDGNSNVSISFN